MSGKGVIEKLGVKPGSTLAVVGAPPALAAVLRSTAEPADADTLLIFARDKADAVGSIAAGIAAGIAAFAPGRRLWFAYPKKSGAQASDLSRDSGWDALARAGFLAVTQIAIDADWSALRFRPRSEVARLTRASEAA